MFYENQTDSQKDSYKQMLTIIGQLSTLFSDSNSPYLPYRIHENIFCKFFGTENLGRKDCSADAKKDSLGIGLKTWVGSNDQKVAEFNKLSNNLTNLSDYEIVRKISEYRNERIRVTKNMYGIENMVYHIVKRVIGGMQIYEHAFDFIDINNIRLLDNKRTNNNIYFTDNIHTYHFSLSKNTLYMVFDNMMLLDSFEVEIMNDPYQYLLKLKDELIEINELEKAKEINEQKLCLRLYSVSKDGKFVFEKSGLNQWNAGGRERHPDEIYIPFPAKDRNNNPDFFPSRGKSFNLRLPDGTVLSAKVCQEKGKAIMSNPNKALGEWLLRKVFEIDQGTLITYEMLEKFNIDSVIFYKHDNENYSIDFSSLGTYENIEKKDEI